MADVLRVVPVDVSRMKAHFVSATVAMSGPQSDRKPKVDIETGEIKYQASLLVEVEGELKPKLIEVEVVGEPTLPAMELVELVEVSARPWAMKDERTGGVNLGVTLQAREIRSASSSSSRRNGAPPVPVSTGGES